MDLLYSILRTYVQAGLGAAAVWLASKGVEVPEAWPEYLSVALVALIGGLAVAGVRWLESRTGTGFWSNLARGVAKVLMIGLSKQPVYEANPLRSTSRHPVWRDGL